MCDVFRKGCLIVVGVCLISSFFTCPSYGSKPIPPKERAALIAIYKSAGGEHWRYHRSWKRPPLASDGFSRVGSEKRWSGVTVRDGHVRFLKFSTKKMEGILPPEIGDLPYLVRLDVSDNGLEGEIPPEIGNLVNLEYLNLAGNRLTGDVPEELGKLTKLQYLNLESRAPRIILYRREGSYFRYGYMVGKPKTRFKKPGKPPKLNRLNMDFQEVLGNMTELRSLNLRGLGLSGELPALLGELTQLEKLVLSENEFEGTIPPQWSALDGLKDLRLDSNRLSGTIPPLLFKMRLLENLDLADNLFDGPLSPELGTLVKLKKLDLRRNRFTGKIPPQLGNLVVITDLYLSHNRLEGNFPPSMNNLRGLRKFLIRSNRLTGPIPRYLINFREFDLDIAYNGLSHPIVGPDDINFLKRMDKDWEQTQTMPPRNITVKPLSPGSAKVSWKPVKYRGNTGGYRVLYSVAGGEEWREGGAAESKTQDHVIVRGLAPGTDYYFIVQTWTEPFEKDWFIFNRNPVYSEYSKPAAASTPPAGK